MWRASCTTSAATPVPHAAAMHDALSRARQTAIAIVLAAEQEDGGDVSPNSLHYLTHYLDTAPSIRALRQRLRELGYYALDAQPGPGGDTDMRRAHHDA